jgi:hypothetical protein
MIEQFRVLIILAPLLEFNGIVSTGSRYPAMLDEPIVLTSSIETLLPSGDKV